MPFELPSLFAKSSLTYRLYMLFCLIGVYGHRDEAGIMGVLVLGEVNR